MKKILTIIFLAAGLIFTSCKDNEEDGLQVQAHDKNAMMILMHTMMSKMDSMKMTGDTDYDFAMMMSMHHEGAINMATEEINKGSATDLKSMAQKIRNAQETERAELLSYIASHSIVVNAQDSAHVDMEMMQSMIKMGQAADIRVITGNTDNDFAQLMSTHHQSAIEMAQTELDHGQDAMMKEMAKKMIEDQQKEIVELQNWLLNHKSY